MGKCGDKTRARDRLGLGPGKGQGARQQITREWTGERSGGELGAPLWGRWGHRKGTNKMAETGADPAPAPAPPAPAAKVAPAGQASAARLARHRALMGLSGPAPPAQAAPADAGAAPSPAPADQPAAARANGGDESHRGGLDTRVAAKKAPVIVLVWGALLSMCMHALSAVFPHAQMLNGDRCSFFLSRPTSRKRMQGHTAVKQQQRLPERRSSRKSSRKSRGTRTGRRGQAGREQAVAAQRPRA